MTTQEVANRLIELCRQGQFKQAHDELYADDAWSIEMKGAPTEKAQGKEALAQKEDMFNKMFEVKGCEVSEPIVADKYFSCTMSLDAIHRESGQPSPMNEVCVYQVKEGKITQEQFFYSGYEQ